MARIEIDYNLLSTSLPTDGIDVHVVGNFLYSVVIILSVLNTVLLYHVTKSIQYKRNQITTL